MCQRATRHSSKPMTGHAPLAHTVVVGAILISLVCAALLTRLHYALSSSPFWDEFVTMWSARSVAQELISPFDWGPGADAPLFRDLEVVVLKLFGPSTLAARLPSVVMSVATILVLFYAGKRMFSVPAGLVACALMVFAPELVVEGARARPYPLFLLLTLLGVLFFHRWMVEPGSSDHLQSRWGWCFVACFVSAMLTHLEAILLLPGFALSALATRGPAVFRGKGVLVGLAMCGAAATLAVGLFLRAEAIPGAIPLGQSLWSGAAHIVVGVKNLEVFAKFVRRAPGGAALLLVAAGGLAYLAADVGRKVIGHSRRQPPTPVGPAMAGQAPVWVPQDSSTRGLMLLYVLLFWVTGAIVFVLGPRWGSETRYLLFVFPLLALVVGATLVRFVASVLPRLGVESEWSQEWVILGFVVLTTGSIGASTLAEVAHPPQEWGYDLAFARVADEWQNGDIMVTVAPMACLVSLGHCDYIAFQQAYETYALESDDGLVEAVTGLPLIMTVEEMRSILDGHSRVWFVSDEGRLVSRYDLDFVQLVWDRMELVANEGGALVFLSSQPKEPEVRREVQFAFEDKFKLLGCEVNGRSFMPGDTIELTLHWQGVNYASYFGTDYSVFVHLVDANGQMWGQADGYPVRGLYPTSHWRSTEMVIPDRRQIMLPLNIPAGRYRLEAGMYLLSSGERLEVWEESGAPGGDSVILSYVTVGEADVDRWVPDNPLRVNLGDEVNLLGYDLVANTLERAGSLSVTLYWRAPAEIERDYTVFVHLVGEGGRIAAQHDGQPEQGFYPTSYWEQGEVVRDEHVLQLPPGLPSGRYELRAGMYLLEDMRRLSVVGGEADRDWVVLTTISVGGP